MTKLAERNMTEIAEKLIEDVLREVPEKDQQLVLAEKRELLYQHGVPFAVSNEIEKRIRETLATPKRSKREVNLAVFLAALQIRPEELPRGMTMEHVVAFSPMLLERLRIMKKETFDRVCGEVFKK